MTAAELLGENGAFARSIPNYESRQGQVDMARAVEAALHDETILLCEAGTGTGKTLAYLVPALSSGKKVIISTATRALQEQIVDHDLPIVAKGLGVEPKVAVMKGLANYVCRRRLQELLASPRALDARLAAALEVVKTWSNESSSGDISELAALPEQHPLWQEITASSETRRGAKCPHFAECFVSKMRREADAAQVVVVNHHLFFADLALRGPHPGRVLPNYDAVVFDEAHQLEASATQFFGIRISSPALERLVRDAERALQLAGALETLLVGMGAAAAVSTAREAARVFWDTLALEGKAGEVRAELPPDLWKGPTRDAWHALDTALEVLQLRLGATEPCERRRVSREQALDSLNAMAKRIEQWRNQLARLVEGARGQVAWLEARGAKVAAGASPIEIAPILRERLFETVPSIVLTSATLATGRWSPEDPNEVSGAFDYLKSRLGLCDEDTPTTCKVVVSPFDFQEQALLYLPRDLPPPNTPAFVAAAVDRVVALNELTEGGSFVLTTSLRAMRALHKGLRRRIRAQPLWLQGEAPKSTLIQRFREAGNGILVATASFWEGVDVPGEALRLVVIEKIPFAVPTDPVVRARSQALEAKGQNAFMELHVPAAAISLKQGFGRLIRTRGDHGIVALLDARIHQRGYGKRLLSALPPACRVEDFEQVKAQWLARSSGFAEPRTHPTWRVGC